MIQELEPGALAGKTGSVSCHPAFSDVGRVPGRT